MGRASVSEADMAEAADAPAGWRRELLLELQVQGPYTPILKFEFERLKRRLLHVPHVTCF